MSSFKWPLMDNHFTWLDRLKICKFFLTPSHFWTQNKFVFELEQKWAKYTGAKYCVAVFNGSVANTLVVQVYKDKNIKKFNNGKNAVLVSAVTWQTNISPWIREGYKPIFCDITLDNFGICPKELEHKLKKNKNISAVFLTALIGYTPYINEIYNLCKKYNVDLMIDNCESTFSRYNGHGAFDYSSRNICRDFTSTTSLYIGHLSSSGSEGGLVFTNSLEDYQYYLSYRSHGMIRQLNEPKYDLKDCIIDDLKENPLTNIKFTFNKLGNNYRTTDIQAYMALLDFNRTGECIEKRHKLYEIYYNNLNHNKFYLPLLDNYNSVPFCLPVIVRDNCNLLDKIKEFLDQNSIEWRPIISGNITRNKCYRKYANYKSYANAEYLNENGLYVGLYPKLKESQVKWLAQELNKL